MGHLIKAIKQTCGVDVSRWTEPSKKQNQEKKKNHPIYNDCHKIRLQCRAKSEADRCLWQQRGKEAERLKGEQTSRMTYLDGKWAARNMKLAQIDYLSTTGGSNSKPSTMAVGGMGLGRGGGRV